MRPSVAPARYEVDLDDLLSLERQQVVKIWKVAAAATGIPPISPTLPIAWTYVDGPRCQKLNRAT
jgi:hypothetical protein